MFNLHLDGGGGVGGGGPLRHPSGGLCVIVAVQSLVICCWWWCCGCWSSQIVVEDIRNFLFGAPGAGGLDLAALNIQRGRDHGIPNYNALRTAYGLPTVR